MRNMNSKAGIIEYKMPKEMADFYLKNRKVGKSSESKKNPSDYLCYIVNEEFGLKGYCTKVIVY